MTSRRPYSAINKKRTDVLSVTKRPYSADTIVHNEELLNNKEMNVNDLNEEIMNLPSSQLFKSLLSESLTNNWTNSEINSMYSSKKIPNTKEQDFIQSGVLIPGIKTKPPLPENAKRKIENENENIFKFTDLNDETGYLTNNCFIENLEETDKIKNHEIIIDNNDKQDVSTSKISLDKWCVKTQELEKQTDLHLQNIQKQHEELSDSIYSIEHLFEIDSNPINESITVSSNKSNNQISSKKESKSSKTKKCVVINSNDDQNVKKLEAKSQRNDDEVESWLSTNNHENFLDFLNKLDDLQIENQTEFSTENVPEHDAEKQDDINTFDDISAILNVLETEDLKSETNIKSSRKVISNKRQESTNMKNFESVLSSTNYNELFNYLETVDQSCMKTLNNAKERLKDVTRITTAAINVETIPKFEELLNYSNVELSHYVIDLTLRLKEKSASVSTLQTELSKLRNLINNKSDEFDKSMKQKLKQQKDDYESVIKRHQKFIDQLIADKKSLNKQCEGLINEMKVLEDRYNTNVKAMDQRHTIELQKAKQMHLAAEKLRRDKWMEGKTQKIKEMTVKSIEPELQNMTIRHQQEITDLRSLHKRELEDLELRAARKTQQQCEALRQQLAMEREQAIAHERDILRQRLEKLVESEEKSYQEQRRRLNSEHAARLAECEERLVLIGNEKERAIEAIKIEYEDKLQTALRRHKTELKNQKESIELEFEVWKNNYRKEQSLKLTETEVQLKEMCKQERDREIEFVIERLEQEANEMKEQIEQAAENRLKRMKEKYEQEINDLEKSINEYKAKYSETKEKLLNHEDIIINMKTSMKQLQSQLQKAKEISDELSMEKNDLREHIKEEFISDIESLRNEIKMLKESKEEDLQKIFMKVKLTVARKDELLTELTNDNKNLQEKCLLLENLLEKQRQEYLIK